MSMGPSDLGLFRHIMRARSRLLTPRRLGSGRRNPRFDLISIMPTYIVGRNELITDLSDVMDGTNVRVLGAVVLGDIDRVVPGTTVLLEDVARIHVLALDTDKIPGNQAFMVNSNGEKGIVFNDAHEIVARRFPDAVKDGIFENKGNQPTKHVPVDFPVGRNRCLGSGLQASRSRSLVWSRITSSWRERARRGRGGRLLSTASQHLAQPRPSYELERHSLYDDPSASRFSAIKSCFYSGGIHRSLFAAELLPGPSVSPVFSPGALACPVSSRSSLSVSRTLLTSLYPDILSRALSAVAAASLAPNIADGERNAGE